MRIENKTADNSLPFGQLMAGLVYRSKDTDKVYIAGFDIEGKRTITAIDNGAVWYGTSARFTPVYAHLVITQG